MGVIHSEWEPRGTPRLRGQDAKHKGSGATAGSHGRWERRRAP